MARAVTKDIGTLVTRTPDVRGGRPRIAGTGVTVQRIVGWYRLGLTPEEIADEFGSKVDLILDAGPLSGDVAVSTVLSVMSKPYRILREGSTSREDLAEFLGDLLE